MQYRKLHVPDFFMYSETNAVRFLNGESFDVSKNGIAHFEKEGEERSTVWTHKNERSDKGESTEKAPSQEAQIMMVLWTG